MKKRILSISIIVSMLAIALVGASLAYFTDKEDVNNDFTTGVVDINLEQIAFDPNKEGYNKIVPTFPIAIDPTVTLANLEENGLNDSEPAYIQAVVTISNFNRIAFALDDPYLNKNIDNARAMTKFFLFGRNDYNDVVWNEEAFFQGGVAASFVDNTAGDLPPTDKGTYEGTYTNGAYESPVTVAYEKTRKDDTTYLVLTFTFKNEIEQGDSIVLFNKIIPFKHFDNTDQQWLEEEFNINIDVNAIQTTYDDTFTDGFDAFDKVESSNIEILDYEI